jgi:ribonucleotide reductase alpha subunit
MPTDTHRTSIKKLHMEAWEKGLKGLYYCRSRSISKATAVSHVVGEMPQLLMIDYDDSRMFSVSVDTKVTD